MAFQLQHMTSPDTQGSWKNISCRNSKISWNKVAHSNLVGRKEWLNSDTETKMAWDIPPSNQRKHSIQYQHSLSRFQEASVHPSCWNYRETPRKRKGAFQYPFSLSGGGRGGRWASLQWCIFQWNLSPRARTWRPSRTWMLHQHDKVLDCMLWWGPTSIGGDPPVCLKRSWQKPPWSESGVYVVYMSVCSKKKQKKNKQTKRKKKKEVKTPHFIIDLESFLSCGYTMDW